MFSVTPRRQLAVTDNMVEFRRAVEEDKACLDVGSSWCGPSAVQGRLAMKSRTMAIVAALYGSTTVLAYTLSVAPREATGASGTDGATALHLAVAGGAANTVTAMHLLLAAGATTEALSATVHEGALGIHSRGHAPPTCRHHRPESAPAPSQVLGRVAIVLALEVRAGVQDLTL
jgi:hypothetical protein